MDVQEIYMGQEICDKERSSSIYTIILWWKG